MISIIIPVYNGEKHLQRCFDSIRYQTYKDFEVIIVDDGSTDSTADICDNMARADSRFYVIHQDNAGVSVARNVALQHAKGDVTFVDADDYVEPDYIEKLKKGLDYPEVDISYCNWESEDEECNIIYNKTFKQDIKQDIISTTQEFDWNGEFPHLSVWGAMFKKDVIKGIAFDKRFFVGEDTLFFACCERKARKIYFVHDVLYHYVVYKESACHGSFNLKKCTLIYAWDEICKLYKNSHEENMLIISLNMKIMEFCFAHYSDPAFLESGCLGELITKYRDTQRVYFEELMKTRQYWELLKGIVFGICPKLYLKLREKKKQLLLSK